MQQSGGCLVFQGKQPPLSGDLNSRCGNPPESLYPVGMSESSPLRETPAMRAFLEAISAQIPDSEHLDSLLIGLRREETLDQAVSLLKRLQPQGRKDDPWRGVRQALEAEAALARQRRIHQWQTDARRRVLRLRVEVRHPACLLHPPALQAALAKTLFDAGLSLAMGLEKSPRPMIHMGHPLPSGVEGHSEWVDAVLREPAGIPLSELPARLRAHCPDGIVVLEALEIPNISSPVLELCHGAHWRWDCPSEHLNLAQQRLALFEAAPTFTIEKSGKVEGRKQIKHVEVRHLIHAMFWKGQSFYFSTRIAPGEAMNPVKILAGILGLESASIEGLIRERVELSEDPRLALQSKYETKLHNIYEDAVLLDGGTGVSVVEDEDDEPLVIQRGPKKPD